MMMGKYITSLLAITMGIFFIPELETAIRVYIVSVVVFTTMLVNLLFNIEKLRQWIVQKIISDVMAELFKNADVRRLLSKNISDDHRSK